MAINKQSYQITGMRQDNLVGTGYSNKFAHEIMNLRLNTVGDYTTASWTTEKGTKEIIVNEFSPMGKDGVSYDWFDKYNYRIENFKPIGQAVINDAWVIFGKMEPSVDMILVLEYDSNDNLHGRILYIGDLNFSEEHPIETLTFYENDAIQKVYWIDGVNQPRVVNIKGADKYANGFNYDETNPSQNRYIPTQFDFVQEVSLREEVDIIKQQSGTGMFPPGTVKYAITYYKKYGQETNIVYDSPLYYPTLGERGCSPDEISGDSFLITVDNIDNTHGFDYIRLYSIIRTSDDATPIVRIVEDKHIDANTSRVQFLDTNTTGEIVDPTILQYVGGKDITAYTFNQKDNTLFLGNITLGTKSVTKLLEQNGVNLTGVVTFGYNEEKKIIPIKEGSNRIVPVTHQISSNQYPYVNELNTFDIGDIRYKGNSHWVKVFKYNEYYRFGVQFQDNKGVWSEVVYIGNAQNTVAPTLRRTGSEYKVAVASFKLSPSTVALLVNNGYKKARLVCCYPNNSNRTIITQGVINPTVYNVQQQESNTPDYEASWFFRPDDSDRLSDTVIASDGNISSRELQSINSDEDSHYVVDRNFWTLNSSEIELDESIRTLDRRAFKIRITGCISLNNFASSVYVDASNPSYSYEGIKNIGLTDTIKRTRIDNLTTSGSHHLNAGIWRDRDIFYPYNGYYQMKHGQSSEEYDYGARNYPLYPFQRGTSLNNYIKNIEWYVETLTGKEEQFTLEQSAKLNSKVFASILYSTTSFDSQVVTPNICHSLEFFDSNEVIPTLIDGKVYYGNVNTVAPIGKIRPDLYRYYLSHGEKASDGAFEEDTNFNSKTQLGWDSVYSYPKNTIRNASFSGAYYLKLYDGSEYFKQKISGTNRYYGNRFICADPVSITYKSTPHIVFKSTTELPKLENINSPVFRLAEVYRDFDYVSSEERNLNNVYCPCGPAVPLLDYIPSDRPDYIDERGNTILLGLEGDHYLMRYDCLKTYPYTTEDTNQIVEILSFPCETKINLDGRYDRNRGLLDNTTILPTNFNLINKSYTQSNNFFTYLTLDDSEVSKLDKFDNMLTWTKPKVSGEDIDAWTNITLASTADADGTFGSITKILNRNGNLYCFQEHGLSVIGYNEKTALTTESGVPLELANSGKYTGLQYLSNKIGCQNKWSISDSKNGIFFIDDSRQELLTVGESMTSISSANGFDAYMINQLPRLFTTWNPRDFSNFVTYYDKLSNDVYYINGTGCLAWNEQSKTFTSFYNYEGVPYMVNIGPHTLMWKNGIWAARELDSYSKFFGYKKPYWITLVCDGMTADGNAFPADKVFNNIEYRADTFNPDGLGSLINEPVFNKKAAWNGYQMYKEFNIDAVRKFSMWRVQLPRATYNMNGVLTTTRDRIRNPFCYIKLLNDTDSNSNRMILHDLAVYFDMK